MMSPSGGGATPVRKSFVVRASITQGGQIGFRPVAQQPLAQPQQQQHAQQQQQWVQQVRENNATAHEQSLSGNSGRGEGESPRRSPSASGVEMVPQSYRGEEAENAPPPSGQFSMAAAQANIAAQRGGGGPTAGGFQNGKLSRVHPSPHEQGRAPLAVPSRAGRGRGSVFAGTPDLPPAGTGGEDDDEDDLDEAEDEHMARSAFHRQRSMVSYEISTHRLDLLVATFNLVVHVAAILTDLMLMADYNQNGGEAGKVSAAAIACIRIMVGLVEVEFDYLNRGWRGGRFLFIPLIFFNGRIVLDYVLYVRQWVKHRHLPWPNSDFRATVSFETFIGSLPLLIVQTYVMIVDPREIQQLWMVAYAMTVLSCSVDLLHHFKYVHVETSVYVAQFVKALISTGMRTVLVAVLLDIIGRVILGWMIISFLFGCFIYYFAYRYAQLRQRDNPFQFGALVCHMSFGGLVAATQLFVAIPFAPSHSIYDWWLGYLLCEFKMAIENFIMLAVVMVSVYGDYKPEIFYAVLGFVLVCYIGNLCAGYFIHQHVRKYLNERDFYSDTAIVRLFAHFLDYFKRAWYPQSIVTHGSAQNHLLYKDQAGKVHAHLAEDHLQQVVRTASLNAAQAKQQQQTTH